MVGADRFEAVLAAAQRLDLRRIRCANLRRAWQRKVRCLATGCLCVQVTMHMVYVVWRAVTQRIKPCNMSCHIVSSTVLYEGCMAPLNSNFACLVRTDR